MTEKGSSFWSTLPGILTALGGLLVAVATLVTALYTAGIIGKDSQPEAPPKHDLEERTETPDGAPDGEEPIPAPEPEPEEDPRVVPEAPEDCLSFETSKLQVRPDGSRWLLTDGRSRMMVFTDRQEAAASLNTIRLYGMNSHCFIGRPNSSMEYWLVNGQAPEGRLSNEDCLPFRSDSLELRREGTQWLLTDGRSRMRMFPKAPEAKQALWVIKHYGFTHACFIGRPDPSFTYFRR